MPYLPGFEYVGPKYGNDKRQFFNQLTYWYSRLNTLTKPEPVTIHEAMCQGLPVIAYGRGCIPEIIGSDSGKIIEPSEEFVPQALKQITSWISEPEAFEAASHAAVEKFRKTYAQNVHRWFDVLACLTGDKMSQQESGFKDKPYLKN